MSDAADEYEVGGADASHGIFTMTTVEDAVIHMHLIQIALLAHSDRTTVLIVSIELNCRNTLFVA